MSTKKSKAIKYIEQIRKKRLSFGEMIESLRISDGLSQVELAKKLNISRAHLCDLEKGRRSITVSRAIALANALGYSKKQFVAKAFEEIAHEAGMKIKITIEVA